MNTLENTTNPFVYTSPILKDKSVTREKIVKEIYDDINSKTCISIMASRQTGKTTLLNALDSEFTDKYIYIHINLEACGFYDIKEVTHEFWSKTKHLIYHYDSTTPDRIIDYFRLLHNNKPIIFLIDEICPNREVAAELLRHIRAYYMESFVDKSKHKHVFVIAGSTDLGDLTMEENYLISPFNIAEKIYLPDFTPSETQGLITRLSDDKFSEIQISKIYETTLGHPYLVQYVCHHLYKLDSKEIDDQLDKLSEFLENVGLDSTTHIQTMVSNLFGTDKLNSNLTKVLEAILNGANLPFSLSSKIIRDLYLQGCIRDNEGVCAIRNPIYQHVFEKQFKLAKQLQAIMDTGSQTPTGMISESRLTEILQQQAESIKQLSDYFQGPQLSNYSGYVAAEIFVDNGSEADSAEKTWTMRVQFTQEQPIDISDSSSACYEKIVVRDGQDTPEVEFTVFLYSETLQATTSRQIIKLEREAHDLIPELNFTLKSIDDSITNHRIYVQVLQGTRLIQTLTVNLAL